MRTILLALLFALFLVKAQYIPGPGGYSVVKECWHLIEDDDFIIDNGPHSDIIVVKRNGERINYPPCPYKPLRHGAAWKAWTEYLDSSLITNLVSQWKVPDTPQQQSNQILYYWNGIEPTDNQAVIQPVLQWGSTPAGGGRYWALSSWFVSGSHGYFFTKLVRAQSGNTITGTLTLLANGTWFVSGKVVESGLETSYVYNPYTKDWTYAYEVLEAYNVDEKCILYPASGALDFNGIEVEAGGKPVTPKWLPKTQTASCGESFTVSDPTSVTLHWDTN